MTRIDDTLTSPYRAVRSIAAPADGPWPGMLTCLASGERRVLVDAETLGPGWSGWDAAPDGHVLGAVDIARTQDGHDVLLPVCPESVESLLSRRRASARPITPGEAVTIGVSVLRGCAELAERRSCPGAWWLTETGRPVFATEAAGPPLLEGALELLGELERAAPHPLAWADAASAVSAVRMSAAELDRAELGLFGVAAPSALDLTPVAARMAGERVLRVAVDSGDAEPPRRALWEALARHVDADVADLVSRATTSVWRRARGSRARRRRTPVIVGAGAAAAVLSVGLMWPAGADGGSTDEGSTVMTSPAPTDVADIAGGEQSPSEQPTESDPSGSVTAPVADADGDLAVIAADLLERWDDCSDDAGCQADVTMGEDASVRAVAFPASRREVVLLDDFGGVAVLRVDDTKGSQPSQLVVIARRDGEWLLRDVHDATQQP